MIPNNSEEELVPQSGHLPLHPLLKLLYIVVTLVGLFGLIYYINGSRGVLDRGYWQSLQEAAGTTFSNEN
jgi:hypothetical protein